MLTHCPNCEITFRVTPEQLKARAGRVRCGECQKVFNALDSLIDEQVIIRVPAEAEPPPEIVTVSPVPTLEAAPDPVVEPVAETAAETAAETIAEATIESAVEETTAPLPAIVDIDDHRSEPALPPEVPVVIVAEAISPAGKEPLPEDISELAANLAIEPTPRTSASQDLLHTVIAQPPLTEWAQSFPPPTSAPRRWPWVIASLIALITLGLQISIAFRVELATLNPPSRPALEALCRVAGCQVGLPQKVEFVSIEISDLHPDTAHKPQLSLTATLKNRAPFAQKLPDLELTLTDTADKSIVRKVLTPADYLTPASSGSTLPTAAIPTAMPPRGDISVAINIDVGDLPASGYELRLFYP